MIYKVGWKAVIGPAFEDQTFKGQIQVSSSDGAASIIPVSITAIKEKISQPMSSQEPGEGEALEKLEYSGERSSVGWIRE